MLTAIPARRARAKKVKEAPGQIRDTVLSRTSHDHEARDRWDGVP